MEKRVKVRHLPRWAREVWETLVGNQEAHLTGTVLIRMDANDPDQYAILRCTVNGFDPLEAIR